jgi:hypothetical protein
MNIEVTDISEASGATESKVRKDLQRGHLDRCDLEDVSVYVVVNRLRRDGIGAMDSDAGDKNDG